MSRYFVFAVVGLVLLLAAISGTAVAVAFPEVISSLDASLILAGWVLSAYQLAAVASMALAGKASDVLGQKVTFILCLLLFTLSSLLCAIAPNVQSLIVFRLLQGIGGGGFVPAAAGIVADAFPRARQQAIGLFTSIFPVGQIIGPNLGGWLVQTLGWRSIFWLNLPLGIAALAASAFLLRPGPRKGGHIDLLGAALLVACLGAFMVGLSMMGSDTGISWMLVVVLLGVSAFCLIAFVRRESKVKDPVLDLEVIRAKPFLAANVYNFVYGACVFGLFAFVPLYAVSVYGMSTLESGVILTPRSIGMMLASTVTAFSLVRWGYRWPILSGTAAVVVCLIFLAVEPRGISIFGWEMSNALVLMAIMLFLGLAVGVAAPAANNACIELMPQKIGTITGIRGMFRQAGGTVSIAVTSLLLHSVGDMALGFSIMFVGLAMIMILTMPTIFIMPGGVRVAPPVKHAGSAGS